MHLRSAVAHHLSRRVSVCVTPGALLLRVLYHPSTPCAAPLHGSRVRMARSLMVAGGVRFTGGMRSVMVDAGDVCASVVSQLPPVWHSVGLLFLYGALDSHPFFPSHVASGCCFLPAAAAGALAGVVSAFAEPSSWRVGTVLNVAWCAVCVSAAPNSWRIEDVLVVAGVD